MGFRTLIEMRDEEIRNNLSYYYIVDKTRIDNIIYVLEEETKTIKEQAQRIADQQEQIKNLSLELLKEKEKENK